MGIYVFDTDVLVEELRKTHEEGGNDFGGHLIPRLLEHSDRLFIHRFKGYWRDVGTLDSYWQANMDLVSPGSGMDISSWKVRTNMHYESLHAMPPSRIGPGAILEGAAVSPGCVINGTVRRSILSPGVVVEEGAVVEDSVIMHKTTIGAGAKVVRAVIDKHVTVGAGVRLGVSYDHVRANGETPTHLSTGITLVGKGAVIEDGAVVGGNVVIHPNVVITNSQSPIPDGTTAKPPLYKTATVP